MNNIILGNRTFWGWYNCVSAKTMYLEIRDSAIKLYWYTVRQNNVYNKMSVLSPKYWYERFGRLVCCTRANLHCTIKIVKHLHYYVNLQTRSKYLKKTPKSKIRGSGDKPLILASTILVFHIIHSYIYHTIHTVRLLM